MNVTWRSTALTWLAGKEIPQPLWLQNEVTQDQGAVLRDVPLPLNEVLEPSAMPANGWPSKRGGGSFRKDRVEADGTGVDNLVNGEGGQ